MLPIEVIYREFKKEDNILRVIFYNTLLYSIIFT